MNLAVFAYPFLFITLFFESFVLVTLLSKPARLARKRIPHASQPTVAVIVPCFNEESTVTDTCKSLLALKYPHKLLEIVLVDDGSTDGTQKAMAHFAKNPRVKIIRKENGGKHTALNVGIKATTAEIFGCLDADSFVEPDALGEIVSSFTTPSVAAVTAAMSVHRPKNILEHMQNAEYIFGITLRHAIASINGLYVTPGPFSFYRRSIVESLGGFREGHKTEDMEMALRIQQAGYVIENALRARVYTKTPRTILTLISQRTRWTTGFLRNMFGEYRGLIGNRRHGALGVLILPLGLSTIAGSILLFSVSLFELTRAMIATLEIRAGIPLTYAYLPGIPSFDWFYFPTNVFMILGILAVLISLTIIIIGKRLSRTEGPLGLGLVSYVFLYGLVVPLWLIRSATDIAFGKKRNWR